MLDVVKVLKHRVVKQGNSGTDMSEAKTETGNYEALINCLI